MISESEQQHIIKLFGHFLLSLRGLGVRPESVLYGIVGSAEIVKRNTTGCNLDEWNEIIKQAQEDVTKGVFAK